MTTAISAATPQSDLDLYSEEALLDPYPLYQELRDQSGCVWLRKYDMFVLSRYQDVFAALKNWRVFSSAQGVMLNERMNETLRGIVLCTDPPEHDELRSILRRPLAPKELKALEPQIQAEADELVERLVARGSFDAATELARHLPLTIVSSRVGLPDEGRERMLDWAFANFQCFGPMNERTREAFPTLDEAVAYSSDPTLRERLTPGGWADRLFQAAEAGEFPVERAGMMLNDYWGPSLDTTIFATASAIWLFGKHPEQWDLLRAQPALIPHAINEIVRIESPIQGFSRVVTEPYEVDGVTMPAGSRVIVLYGSANRDERKWEHPETFDILRKPSDHVAFGFGEHQCLGMPLARLELRALLSALIKRVERFELGDMERAVNNILRGIRKLEVTVR